MKTLREKGLTHALKKAPGSKKRKKNAEKEAATDTTVEQGSNPKDASSDEGKKAEKRKEQDKVPQLVATNGIKNSSTASLTKKVLEEQEARNKRRKLEQNDNVKSLFSKGNAKPSVGNSADYMTRGFSIGAKK
jgi:hypothetical protein